MHQKSQHQPGAKVEPDRRTTAPDSRAHAVFRRSPPAEKATACQDQAGKASTGDGTGNWCGGIGSDDARKVARGRIVVMELRKSAKD